MDIELNYDSAAFLRDHWRPRKTAVLRAVLPQDARRQFSFEQFRPWLKAPVSGGIYTRTLDQQGGIVGSSSNLEPIGSALEQFAEACGLGMPATLFLYDLNHNAPEFVALRNATGIGQHWRSSSFSATISAVDSGIGYHADVIDVMLFQVQGRRRWRVYERPAINSPVRNDLCEGAIPAREDGWAAPADARLLLEADLEPGDAIFLPALHFHDGLTLPADEDSVAVCIGWRAVTPYMFLKAIDAELAQGRLAEMREHYELFFDPVPDLPDGMALLSHLTGVLDPIFALLGVAGLQGQALRNKLTAILHLRAD